MQTVEPFHGFRVCLVRFTRFTQSLRSVQAGGALFCLGAMVTRDDETKTRGCLAPSYGWVRCLASDTADRDAWEKPNGDLVFMAKGAVPKVVSLRRLVSEVTGRPAKPAL